MKFVPLGRFLLGICPVILTYMTSGHSYPMGSVEPTLSRTLSRTKFEFDIVRDKVRDKVKYN